MANDRRPWERRDDETDSQFLAFKCYRDLGLARTITKAWDRYSERKGLKSDNPTGAFETWKKQNDWTQRAKAWDRHVDDERRATLKAARDRAREKFAKRAERLAEELIDIALGETEAKRAQVKALKTSLDKLGLSETLDIDLEGTLETNRDELRSALDNLEDKTTAELARAYFAEIEGGGETTG